MGEEGGRGRGGDVQLGRSRRHQLIGWRAPEQMLARAVVGEGPGHGDHRIDQTRGVGAGIQMVGLVDRLIQRLGEAGRERRGQVSAGREPDHCDPRGVDPMARRLRADEAHGALGVLQRHVRAVPPSLRRQTVVQHEHGVAKRVHAPGDIDAFVGHGDELVPAAGDDQQGRPVRPLGWKGVQARRPSVAQEDRREVGRKGRGVEVGGSRRALGPERLRRRPRPCGRHGLGGGRGLQPGRRRAGRERVRKCGGADDSEQSPAIDARHPWSSLFALCENDCTQMPARP